MKEFPFTLTLTAVIAAVFILDTFVFVPKGIKVFSKKHIFDGDKTGYITKALRLSYSDIKRGQVWRLFSQVFLHVGIPHLFFNSLALLLTGYALETTIGTVKTLLAFLFSSFFSALIMCFGLKFEDGEGASTGIYGLIAVYVLTAVKQRDILFSSLPWYLAVIIGIYAIVGMLLNKIDRWEHSTGFLGGLIFGAAALFLF